MRHRARSRVRMLGALALTIVCAAIGDAQEGPARLLAVSSTADADSYTVLLETAADVQYRTYQPDALTIAIELEGVTGRSAANRFAAVPDGPVQAVTIDERRELDGEFVTVVRLAIRQPMPYRVTMAGGVIRVQFARLVDDEGAAGTAGELPIASGNLEAFDVSEVATLLTDVETRRVPEGTEVTLSGNGRLLAGYIGPVSGPPPRLMLDFPDVRATVSSPVTPDVPGPVERIRVALNSQTPLVTRVVLDLADSVDYEIVSADSNPGGITLLVKDLPAEPADRSQALPDAPAPTGSTGVIAVGDPLRIDPMTALREQEQPAGAGDGLEPVQQAALPPAVAPVPSDPSPTARPLEAQPAAAPLPETPEPPTTDRAMAPPEVQAVDAPGLAASPPVMAADAAAVPVVDEPAEVSEPLTSPAAEAPVATAPETVISDAMPGTEPVLAATEPAAEPPLAAPAPLPQAPAVAPAQTAPPAPASNALPAVAAAQAPAAQSPPAPPAAPQYTGHLVSLDFQNADLRAVLRTFAEISGLNMVIDPTVDGSVDVALTDVPWDQALDIILRANDLGYSVDGTVVRIASLDKLRDEEEKRSQLAQAQALSGELHVLTRSLSYARASELAELLTRTVLSPRGSAQVDERTNTLILNDLQDRLDTAVDLITKLDRPEPQVEIEARIVQTTRDFARAIGVQWGVAGRVSQELGNTTGLIFPNTGSLSGRTGATQGPPDARASQNDTVGTATNLGVTGATSALGLALGAVNGSFNLDVVLSALERTGQGRVLSTPRVSTQNNVEAEMTQGIQIPIQTVANNTVTVTFKDAALTLRVIPQITASRTVIMRITLENATPDFTRSVNGIPPIDTQRAITQVQVDDGATTVLGGIFISREQQVSDRTPFLHRIPLLGWLFRRDDVQDSSRELLIFITPRILKS